MAATTPQANQAWQNALKLRRHLLKQLDKIKSAGASGVDLGQLEAADGTLEKFRLACVQTVFLDFEFAVDENTEQVLWSLHTSINSEYRRILGRLKASTHAVERRKTEKLYSNFLRIAQKFYQGYIQRLSARYDIPELRRVATGIQAEQMAAGHLISPVPSELNAKVLRSCHATLIHLGDLARYRVQAKHKNSGYDVALTYYTLAQHLLPKSGFAFNQMGIVSLDQGNHLDGVYHFYRAWAIKFPHPNAKPNLEIEFKSLQQPSSNKSKHVSSSPKDAFTMWFVRLHALFYKGEAAPQHNELEQEVLHRLEMAAANGSSRDVILRMSFINMAAQHIAAIKCSENTNAASLQFYQYISSFNVKFLTTFATALEANLKETLSTTDDTPEDDTDKAPQVQESLLPAFRVYAMWLAASRQELFVQDAAAAQASLLGTMVDTIARVFTLICVQTYNKDNLVSCPYLLPEDLDILGFQPLSETAVPEACRSFCTQDGKVKPHLYSAEDRLEPEIEKLARILDILRCAYFLTEDPAVALSYRVADNNLLFEYQPAGAQPQLQEPMEAPASRKGSTAPPATINVQKRRSVQTNNEDRQDSPKAAANGKQLELATAPPPSCTLPPAPANTAGEVGDAESTVINMLAPFLRPPTPQPHQSPQEQETPSSYGVHHSAAKDSLSITQRRPPELSPTRSIPSGKFEPLPWEWFNTPKPVRGDNSPLSAAAMSPIATSLHSGQFDDPFSAGPSSPARVDGGGNGGFPRVSSHGSVRAADMGINLSGGSTAEHAHRTALLQTFAAGGGRPPSIGAARTSPFSHWGESKGGGSYRQQMGLSAPPGLRPPEMMAPSSSTGSLSQFSHPSSLYQGTPATIGRNCSVSGGQGQMYGSSAYKDQHYYQQQNQRQQQHQQRHQQRHQQQQPMQRVFQADNTTSSYDEAILRAAYEGRD